MIELIDTHCHIQSINETIYKSHTAELWAGAKTNSTLVIESAKKDHVSRLICVGCDLEDSKLATEFVNNKDNIFASVGIHPHEAKNYINQPEKLAEFEELVSKPKVVAIGECGLDYYYEHSSKDDQIVLLKFQIELAIKYKKPIIFHVREAYSDFWPIFNSYEADIKGVLHSFTDNKENLDKALQKGLYIGVNGIATFSKNEAQVSVYKSIPLASLLLETDSPYLTPVPYRGTINEPKRLKTVAEFLAKLRTENIEDLASVTTNNASKLFGI